MPKLKLGAVPLVCPIPIVLIGATVEGQVNFTEVGDCAIMGIKPALVVISLSETHHTTKGVDATQAFSINVPSTRLLSKADCCGIVSGRDVDKSSLFTVFAGEHTGAPLIDECPIGLECRVLNTVQVQHRRMFIAEVLETYVDADCASLEDGKPILADLSRFDPIIYALDNQYYRIGDAIGVGYREGQKHLAD